MSISITNPGTLSTFVKVADQKATSILRITNQTSTFLIFKVKSNAPEQFTILPTSTGIVKPNCFASVRVHLSADANLSKDYRLLFQSIYLDNDDINLKLDPSMIWRREILSGKKEVNSTKLRVNIEFCATRETEQDPPEEFLVNIPIESEAPKVTVCDEKPAVEPLASNDLNGPPELEKIVPKVEQLEVVENKSTDEPNAVPILHKQVEDKNTIQNKSETPSEANANHEVKISSVGVEFEKQSVSKRALIVVVVTLLLFVCFIFGKL